MKRTIIALAGALFTLGACSEAVDGPGASTNPNTNAGAGSSGGDGGSAPLAANESALTVGVPDRGRVYVSLSPLTIASIDEQPDAWDLAFEGAEVFTNGGASGPGKASAFGPLDAEIFETEKIPALPFMMTDAAGGPFVDWYKYDGVAHALWSRYHVYGVRDGERLYKVQILGYYGDVGGAPVSALYRLRYAEVTASGVGQTHTLVDLDGTGSGASGDGEAPAACLDLGTGQSSALTLAEAEGSKAWHLCFRRESITVNSGVSGPRGVVAVDLQAAKTDTETVAEISKRTAQSELSPFDAVTHATLSDPSLSYRGDGIRSAFTDQWVTKGSNPLSPVAATWVVVDAVGERHLVKFPRFVGATGTAPGAVELHEKPTP